MFQAVGKENKVNRLHAFNKIKSSDFHSKPLEILFADIDSKIDASLGNSPLYHKDKNGRMISPYSHSTYHKYGLILGVTEHLVGEFNQIRDFIEQEISGMFEDYKTLIDIQAFQEKLVTEFTTRNQIKIFRTKDIPHSKKHPNINTSDITEKKKTQDKANIREEFHKKNESWESWEAAKELAESFINLCNDKNLLVKQVPEIRAILKEKNWRICIECFSSNCQLLQHLSKVHKTPQRTVGNCKGKSITMGEIPEALKSTERHLPFKPSTNKQVNGNTTAIDPIANNSSQDPHEFLNLNPVHQKPNLRLTTLPTIQHLVIKGKKEELEEL